MNISRRQAVWINAWWINIMATKLCFASALPPFHCTKIHIFWRLSCTRPNYVLRDKWLIVVQTMKLFSNQMNSSNCIFQTGYMLEHMYWIKLKTHLFWEEKIKLESNRDHEAHFISALASRDACVHVVWYFSLSLKLSESYFSTNISINA